MSYTRYPLYLASIFVLVVAIIVGVARHHHKIQHRIAEALLQQAMQADNKLTYSAVSNTMVVYGGRRMEATARIVRTPHSMAISYVRGADQGLQCGFNQHWFWRQQPPVRPMQAYAEVRQDPMQMASDHFELMMKNYYADCLGQDKIGGKTVQVVELRPRHSVSGAWGPRKRLWIDEETGLPLRVDTYNYQKQLVMSSTLTEIDLHPRISEATFTSPKAMQDQAKVKPWVVEDMGDDASAVAHATGMEPPTPDAASLPPGFQFDHYGIHRCVRGQHRMVALSEYTDGLNTLSLFATHLDDSAATGDRPKPNAPTTQKASAVVPGNQFCIAGDGKAGNQTVNFGSGTLVLRETAQTRVSAVSDLPPDVLNHVLDATQIRYIGTASRVAGR